MQAYVSSGREQTLSEPQKACVLLTTKKIWFLSPLPDPEATEDDYQQSSTESLKLHSSIEAQIRYDLIKDEVKVCELEGETQEITIHSIEGRQPEVERDNVYLIELDRDFYGQSFWRQLKERLCHYKVEWSTVLRETQTKSE